MFVKLKMANQSRSVFPFSCGIWTQESVFVTESPYHLQDSTELETLLFGNNMQLMLISGTEALSGRWVQDVVRTGANSWRPLYILMMCSLTCVTSALKEASAHVKMLGCQTAFGMTSRWLLIKTRDDMALDKMRVENITLDNVSILDFRQALQGKYSTSRTMSMTSCENGHMNYTLMRTTHGRAWTEIPRSTLSVQHIMPCSAASAPSDQEVTKDLKHLDDSLFPNTRFGFSGRRLKVLVKEWISFVKPCNHQSRAIQWCGLLLDLLEAASKSLNFTYDLLDGTKYTWGTGAPPAPQAGFYGQVYQGKSDVGLIITDNTLERATTLDFSDAFIYSPMVMVYRKPNVTNMFVLFTPLRTSMIMLIMGLWLVVTLLMCVLETVSGSLWEQRRVVSDTELERQTDRDQPRDTGVIFPCHRHKVSRQWVTSLERSMHLTVSAILSEASHLQPKTRPARVLLYSWWMLSLIVAAAYSGILTAVLSVNKQPRLFSDLQDLVTKEHDYKWGTFVNNTVYLYLKNSEDRVHKAVWNKMKVFASEDPSILYSGTKEMAQKLRTEKFVLIMSRFYVDWFLAQDCSMEIVPVDIRRAMYSLVFPKGSAIVKPFSEVIRRLQSGGLFSFWMDKWFPKAICMSSTAPVVISWLHVQGVMLVLPIGMGLASLVLTVETCYARRRMK